MALESALAEFGEVWHQQATNHPTFTDLHARGDRPPAPQVTDYKVQGKTLDYFILCIGPRKEIRPTLSLTDLYVLVSRVRQGKRLYVLGFDPKVDGDHLHKLKHSPVLGIWRAGYSDDGRWDAARAARLHAIIKSLSAPTGDNDSDRSQTYMRPRSSM